MVLYPRVVIIWISRQGAAAALVALTAVTVTASLLLPSAAVLAAAKQPPAVGAPHDYAHVARILETQCASCHNPQGGAPFNLLTYDDAKQWGGQILDVTQSRYMPPWLPAPGKGDFAGVRRLSDADLAAIRGWVGAGMPAGAPAPAEKANDAEPGWAMGKPDAVLTLDEPVKLPGNGADVFRNLEVAAGAAAGHALRAIEIRPSDPQAVRSVWLTLDEDGSLHKSEAWQKGIAGMEAPAAAVDSTAGLIFWLSGAQAIHPRAQERWFLGSQGALLLTTHLKTTGRKQDLQIQVGLYYSPASAPAGSALVLQLAHKGDLAIPAGAANTLTDDSYLLPQAVAVTAIYPRAHFLARSLEAYASTPAGKQVPLLTIPKWDVDWLEVYSYRKPVQLPAGSVVHWKYEYDNSSENPHNPSDPPAAVHAGTDPKDEEADLMLELLPPPGADGAAWRKAMTQAAAK